MKYRRLGSSGLKVSVISLGSWLTYGKTVEDNVAERTIHRAMNWGSTSLTLPMCMNKAKGSG